MCEVLDRIEKKAWEAGWEGGRKDSLQTVQKSVNIL